MEADEKSSQWEPKYAMQRNTTRTESIFPHVTTFENLGARFVFLLKNVKLDNLKGKATCRLHPTNRFCGEPD